MNSSDVLLLFSILCTPWEDRATNSLEGRAAGHVKSCCSLVIIFELTWVTKIIPAASTPAAAAAGCLAGGAKRSKIAGKEGMILPNPHMSPCCIGVKGRGTTRLRQRRALTRHHGQQQQQQQQDQETTLKEGQQMSCWVSRVQARRNILHGNENLENLVCEVKYVAAVVLHTCTHS